MKLQVLADARFSCACCSNCCRNWHVELLDEEIARLPILAWPAGDPLAGEDGLMRHAGKTYLKHAEDSACVFLNRTTKLCRIHEQFGEDAKPLGCRLYPFQIVPTVGGTVTVTGRYDCPTVRKNQGATHATHLPELKVLAARMTLSRPFAKQDFTPDQMQAVCEFLGTMMNGFARDDQRALFMMYLCSWLSSIQPSELDRTVLARAFSELKGHVEKASGLDVAGPKLIHRVAFRTLLGLYLRRDEDVLDGRAGRVGRLIAMIRIVLGGGGFKGLGIVHPPGSLRIARIFQTMPAPPFAMHWQMIRSKLESRQFMGYANHGKTFLQGLQALALLYPMVLAAARYRSRNRGVDSIDEADIDFAVGAIEHSFGRGAVLGQSFVRSLEKLLLEPAVYTRLVKSMT